MRRRTPEALFTPIDWQSKKLIGYHATSLHALKILESTGFLPPTPYSTGEEENGSQGYLHFYPTIPYMRAPETSNISYVNNGNYMMARYGGLNARIHHIASQFALDLADGDVVTAVLVLVQDPTRDAELAKELREGRELALDVLHSKILSLDSLHKTLDSSKGQSAIVLGLSAKAQEKYPVDNDPYDNLAKRIYVPGGLEMGYVLNARLLEPGK